MFKQLQLITILCLIAQIAIADDNYQNAVVSVQAPHQYMVSAILKKNVSDSTVRLVQSVEMARSKDEASGILLRRIRADFAGYSIVESLVAIIPTMPKQCDTWL